MIQLTHVTEENFEEVSHDLPGDQSKELQIGCVTIKWLHDGTQMTCWPEEKRAAVFYGGDSEWGDYTGTPGQEDYRFIPDFAPGLS